MNKVWLPTAQGNQKKDIQKWMTYIVYHIRSGIASTKSYLSRNIREKFLWGKRAKVGAILRELCNWKGINIINDEVCPGHVHMLVEIPPKMSVSGFMRFLKGKSSLVIYEKFGNMKFKYWNREFWCRGYYVDTVAKNTEAIRVYIDNQLKEDMMNDSKKLTRSRVASKLLCANGNCTNAFRCSWYFEEGFA